MYNKKDTLRGVNNSIKDIIYQSTMLEEIPLDPVKADGCGCNPEKFPGIVPYVAAAAIFD